MKTLIPMILLLWIVNAEARLMLHYKMDSFYLMADAVILCEETDVQYDKKKHHGNIITLKTIVTCDVTKAFKGGIKQGTEIEIVYDSIFRRNRFGDWGHMDNTQNPPVMVPPKAVPKGRALIFLKLLDGGKGYRVITAKLIQKDGIFQYKQGSNPGPYVLSPQVPENVELRDGVAYTEQVLLNDLTQAIEKSKSLKEPISEGGFRPLTVPKK